MTMYRLRKTVDVVVSADEENEIQIGELIGQPGVSVWRSIDQIRSYGWEVTRITTPAEDPAGTIRQFNTTGDEAIKALDGTWWYIGDAGHYGKATSIDIESCPSDIVS